jgi:hypothetical protein
MFWVFEKAKMKICAWTPYALFVFLLVGHTNHMPKSMKDLFICTIKQSNQNVIICVIHLIVFFFSSILWFCSSGDHPQKYLAKFVWYLKY